MKNILKISMLVLMVVFASCKDNKSENKEETIQESNQPTTNKSQATFSIETILDNYLKLKNALVEDNSEVAAQSGKELAVTLNSLNADKMEQEFKKEYADIAEDVKEHANHIGANADNIAHQREHFVTLSKDIEDLIELFGTNKKLYLDFCPMADENKGAVWISEKEEIKNPYFGSQMLSCGSVKKEF